MLKILTARHLHQADADTLTAQHITSYQLMERACRVFVGWWQQHLPLPAAVSVWCGLGNNGGDGLTIARLLHQAGCPVQVYIVHHSEHSSPDFQYQYNQLKAHTPLPIYHLHHSSQLPSLPPHSYIVDALLGSGANRPAHGLLANIIHHLNNQPAHRISIDTPSGLLPDTPTTGICIKAHHTLCFEVPKPAFFWPENAPCIGQWHCRSIGIPPDIVDRLPAWGYVIRKATLQQWYRPRPRHAHKGTHGHALLVCGSEGKIGAAVLAARACLRAGVGLLTARVPGSATNILHTALPEAMVWADTNPCHLQQLLTPDSLAPYRALGIGCGIGTHPATASVVQSILQHIHAPAVLDADALNLLSTHPHWWQLLPPNTILTPHPREADRLFGTSTHTAERLERASQYAQQYQTIIVLKGGYTAIILPNSDQYFHTGGNPGMATGGSGDALTGIITALLAQGYPPPQAAILGVWLHGAAGDVAAQSFGHESLLPSDLIEHLPAAFRQLTPSHPSEPNAHIV